MKQPLLLLAGALALAEMAGTAQAQTPGVGIGTTAPDASAALDIVSSDKGVLLPRVADATALASPATGLIVFQTGSPAGFYYNAGTPAAPSWQQLATASGAAITADNGLTKTGQNIQLGGPLTGNTAVGLGGNSFGFTGSGNVGVGTATPAYPLDVVSGLRVSSPTAAGGASLSQAVVSGGVNSLDGQSFTLPVGTVVRSIVVYANSGSGTLELYQGTPGSGAALSSQAVTYTPGYGPTTVPLATPLTVAAPGVYSFRLTGFDYLSFANGNPYAGGAAYSGTSATAADLRFDVNYDGQNAATLFAAPSGLVGINTLTPTANLDVNGSTRLRGLAAPGVVLTDANGNLSSGSAVSALGSNFIQNQNATDQPANFRISGTGALGGMLQFNSTDADKIYLTYLGAAGSKIGHAAGWGVLNYAGPGTGGTVGFHSWLTTTGAAYQERMRLTDSGLGIGTSAPGSTLDVRGTANVSNTAGSFQLFQFPAANNTVLMGDFSGLNSNGPQLRFEGSGAAGSFMDIGQNGAGDFVVEGTDAPRLTVLNGGRVGVGTSTPGAMLDVQGGADNTGANDPGALAFSYRSGGYRHFVRSRHNSGLGAGGNDLDFYLNNSNTAAGSSAAGTGNTHVLTLENNNGQAWMGLGTTVPGGRLHIVNDAGGGGASDDYLIDEYGPGDQGLYLRRSNGTVAAPVTLANNDFIGQLVFVPRVAGGLGYSGSRIASYYRGDGTTMSTDLQFVTSSTEHLRLLPTGALWQLNTNNNILLTTGTTTAPTGGGNVVLGNAVGSALTSGYQNVLLGQTAGNHLTTGYNNVLLGNGPGDALTTGADNILIGASAGSGTSGSANIMVGGATGAVAGTAERSVFVGYASGNQTTGNRNTLVGYAAGQNTAAGTNNVALGHAAGYDNTSGSNNTFLGADTNANANNLTNATAVGYGARVSQSNSVILGDNASVGIGTSAPFTRLSLSPGTTEPKITLYDGGSTANHYGFGVSNSQLNYHVYGNAASHVFSAGGKNGDGTELMRVRGDGHVGIGTNSPSGQLANNSGNTIGSDNQGGNGGSLSWAATQQGYVGQIYNAGTDGNSNGLVVKVDGTNPNATVLDVSKGTQNTLGTSLLAVRASGQVGIGINTPQATLDVNGSTRLRGLPTAGVVTTDASGNLSSTTLSSLGATTASNGLTKTGADVALGGTLTQNTTLTQAGNSLSVVGIATTPQQISQLATTNPGNAAATLGQGFTLPAGATITQIDVYGNGGTNTFTVYQGAAISGTVLGSQSVTYNTGQALTSIVLSPAITVSAAGLYSFNTGSTAAFALHTGNPYAGGTSYSGTSSVAGVDMKFAVYYTTSAAAPTLYAGSNATVGIGTASPTATLDVAGTARVRSLPTAGVVTTDASGNLSSSATVGSLDATTASNGLTRTGTDVALGGALTQPTTISGISSTNSLELIGTSATRITNTTAAAAASTRVLGLYGQYSSSIAGSGAHLSFLEGSGFEVGRIAATQDVGSYLIGMSFSTTNGSAGTVTERLRISPAGNVGIGIDPAAKLDVNGTARLGTNGTTFNAIIRAAITQTVGPISAGSAVTVTFTVANVVAGGTAYVSPSNDLANGISISYARTATGQVIAKFYNATGGTVTVASGVYNITVVQ
jgi:hypothetical protein